MSNTEQQAWEAEAKKAFPMPDRRMFSDDPMGLGLEGYKAARTKVNNLREGYIAALSSGTPDKNDICPDCNGTGLISTGYRQTDYELCKTCNGDKIKVSSSTGQAEKEPTDDNPAFGNSLDDSNIHVLSELTDKQLQKEAEAYANNCLDITTTTWEWIVDAYITCGRRKSRLHLSAADPYEYPKGCEYPECECEQIITHRCKHRLPSSAAGEGEQGGDPTLEGILQGKIWALESRISELEKGEQKWISVEDKEQRIKSIRMRIEDEYKKHHTLLPNEWANIAAHKIYATHFPSLSPKDSKTDV